jgi:glucose/mannose-6-phosphate isomerase
MNLDDLDHFRRLDPTNVLQRIDALPAQVEAAWALGQSLHLPEPFYHYHAAHVLIAGRGDSAIAGDFARTAALPESRLPLTLWQTGDLPAWVNAQTLVIAISFSGETRETVRLAEAALARGARVLAITTGGRLAALPGATTWAFSAAGDSRTALGWLSLLTLAALVKLGCAEDRTADVAEAVSALRTQQQSLRADSPVIRNPAKRMAGQLLDRNAVLFVTDDLAPAGRYWQSKINQFAKAWAHCLPLSEADHAQAGTLFPEALADKTLTLFLRRSQSAPDSDAVRMHFLTSGFGTDFIFAAGESRLAQLLTLAHYGDYVAYYLAMCYEVDPDGLSTNG